MSTSNIKSELKNTTAASHGGVNVDVSVAALVKAIDAELAGKDRADVQGNKRRELALQIAMSFPETLAVWKVRVEQWHGKDGKLRDACRVWAMGILELTNDDDGAYRRNKVAAFMGSLTFAVDMIANKYESDIVFADAAKKTVTKIKGDSRLLLAVWRVEGWNDKTPPKCDTTMHLVLAGRTGEKERGKAVSWAQLDAIVRDIAGRKQASRPSAVTISENKPVEALQTLSVIAGRAKSEHFGNVASRLQAIDTAEDIAALGTVGDSMSDARKQLEIAFQRVRDLIKTEAAAVLKEHKGDPEAAALVRAAMSGK